MEQRQHQPGGRSRYASTGHLPQRDIWSHSLRDGGDVTVHDLGPAPRWEQVIQVKNTKENREKVFQALYLAAEDIQSESRREFSGPAIWPHVSKSDSVRFNGFITVKDGFVRYVLLNPRLDEAEDMKSREALTRFSIILLRRLAELGIDPETSEVAAPPQSSLRYRAVIPLGADGKGVEQALDLDDTSVSMVRPEVLEAIQSEKEPAKHPTSDEGLRRAVLRKCFEIAREHGLIHEEGPLDKLLGRTENFEVAKYFQIRATYGKSGERSWKSKAWDAVVVRLPDVEDPLSYPLEIASKAFAARHTFLALFRHPGSGEGDKPGSMILLDDFYPQDPRGEYLHGTSRTLKILP